MELEGWLEVYQALAITAGTKERSYWTAFLGFLLGSSLLALAMAFLFLAYSLPERQALKTVVWALGLCVGLGWWQPNDDSPGRQRYGPAYCGAWRGSSPGRNFIGFYSSSSREPRRVSQVATGNAVTGIQPWPASPFSARQCLGFRWSYCRSFSPRLGLPRLQPAGSPNPPLTPLPDTVPGAPKGRPSLPCGLPSVGGARLQPYCALSPEADALQ